MVKEEQPMNVEGASDGREKGGSSDRVGGGSIPRPGSFPASASALTPWSGRGHGGEGEDGGVGSRHGGRLGEGRQGQVIRFLVFEL